MYTNTISWSTPTTPLPMEINPRVVFERLFGQPGTAGAARAPAAPDLSILDLISKEASDLQRGLGPRDRERLSEYLDNVREIERRIQRTETQPHRGDITRRAGRDARTRSRSTWG